MEVTDTHCHLNFDSFDNDRNEVLMRARGANVFRILNPGINLESCKSAIKLSEDYPEVYAAVGIHPNEAGGYSKKILAELRSMAQHPKVIAIGEIGLDYYRNKTPIHWQKKLFRMQLDLAGELGLPVVIHNREATNDILNILDLWVQDLRGSGSALVERPGVLHSFSGSALDASRSVELGLKIGITGPITFKNSQQLHKVVSDTDLGHVLIETDAPFLTPHPYRGKRNEPSRVVYIAQKISLIKNIPVEIVANITTRNAADTFHW